MNRRSGTLVSVFFIIITSVIVLVLFPALGLAQQKSPDRLGALEERMKRLEGKADSPPVRVESEAHAVGEIAKMTLESYDRNFGIITWVATAVSVLIGLFAWFGFNEYRQVIKPLEPLRKRQEDLIQQVRDESSRLTALGSELQAQKAELQVQKADLDTYREAMLRDVEALIRTVSAFTYTQTANTELHKAALRELEKALDRQPSHPKVVGWAYSMRGYLTRRLVQWPGGLLEALDYARRAIEVDPQDERAYYNAACYACLMGRTAEWIMCLTRATELNPEFRGDALQDTDFALVQESPDFQRLTAQG